MTPEQKYHHVLRDQRSRKRWRAVALLIAIVLSVLTVVASPYPLTNLLTVSAMWLSAFMIYYFARNFHTVVAYFSTIHHFLRQQDGIQSPAPQDQQTQLTPAEANAFDDLVNRLRKS